MYKRLSNLLLSDSFFLFGGRGTGKSTLIKDLLGPSNTLYIDLLDEELALRFLAHPEEFKSLLLSHQDKEWVFIDEIQRVPALLNYVHQFVENKKMKFALTGSSARKLKRGQANMLAGRAFLNYLHPLTSIELGSAFDLKKVLQWGSLPKVVNSTEDIQRKEFLKAYVQTYLKEEIKEEQLVRKLHPFLKFLEVSAQCNGKILNYSKIARDCSTDAQTVERYFEILVDTLLVFFLDPFHESIRKRQSKSSKFYYFDLGVQKALNNTLGVELVPQTSWYGEVFEHFFILECIRLNDYFRTDYRFSYIRTKEQVEIDLVIERPGKKRLLLEIKSSTQIHQEELRSQLSLAKDIPNSEFWVVSCDELERQGEGYECIFWKNALQKIFIQS